MTSFTSGNLEQGRRGTESQDLLLPDPELPVLDDPNPSPRCLSPSRLSPPSLSAEPKRPVFQDKAEDRHAALETASHGIYWRSPMLMAASWLGGLLFCIAHHVLYALADGNIVGSLNEQQWNIRYDLIC